MDGAALGVATTLAAGAIGSSTLAPMKYVKNWQWENTWLVYSVHAYFLFPLGIAFATVPHLTEVYRAAGLQAALGAALWGAGWGFSVVLYGLALSLVGLSLTSGIIFGCSVALGSLIPLAHFHSTTAFTAEGLAIAIANLLMLAGVGLCARAGGLRAEPKIAARGKGFAYCILLCFAAGALSPMLNLALAFGGPITDQAVRSGASAAFSANAVWGLTVSAGCLPSVCLCLYLLRQNGTWKCFHAEASLRNASLCVLMGLLFIASTVIYGSAANLLGSMGPVIGWPIYLSSLIIGNNFWGWYTGEWKGAPARAVQSMAAGVGLQVVAIGALSNIR